MERVPRTGTLLATAKARAAVGFEKVAGHLNASGARRLLGLGPGSSVSVGVAPEESMVWMHGGFWYQGEYLFEPAGPETAITCRVRNISGLPDWFIRTWQRTRLRSLQRDLERFARELPGRVGP